MAKADDKKTNKAVAAEKKADDGKLKALGLAMDQITKQFGDGSIGFGIDKLTRDSCTGGMIKYQKVIHDALDPKSETFRQLKEAQIKNMRRLDRALSKYTHIPAVK